MIVYSHGCEQHSPEPSRPHSIDSIDKVPIIRPGLATVIWTRRYGRACLSTFLGIGGRPSDSMGRRRIARDSIAL